MGSKEEKLRFFLTESHACNYLENQQASSLFADPIFPKDKALYTALVANGFRRSGDHLYRPYCETCSECIPVRIPVNEFIMNRNQKRTWNKNQDLYIEREEARFTPEHFELYKKYLGNRHANGGMDNPDEGNYREFLWSTWSKTELFVFRLKQKLIGIAVVDPLKDALSAVYTFFDPDYSQRSPGKFMVLYLIDEARRQSLSHLYLGYWIANCQKMKYKIEYQPIECLVDEEWKKISQITFNDFKAD